MIPLWQRQKIVASNAFGTVERDELYPWRYVHVRGKDGSVPFAHMDVAELRTWANTLIRAAEVMEGDV